MDDSRRPRNLKPYEKPTVTKLTRRQQAVVRAHADRGDPGAKELFEGMLAHAPAKDTETTES
jgi:hypothetical protein